MPIKEIQTYARLRAIGNPTMPQRMDMLTKHRTVIQQQIARLREHLGKLDAKIDYYQAEINTRD